MLSALNLASCNCTMGLSACLLEPLKFKRKQEVIPLRDKKSDNTCLNQHMAWRQHLIMCKMTENHFSVHILSAWDVEPMLLDQQQEESLDGKQISLVCLYTLSSSFNRSWTPCLLRKEPLRRGSPDQNHLKDLWWGCDCGAAPRQTEGWQ